MKVRDPEGLVLQWFASGKSLDEVAALLIEGGVSPVPAMKAMRAVTGAELPETQGVLRPRFASGGTCCDRKRAATCWKQQPARWLTRSRASPIAGVGGDGRRWLGCAPTATSAECERISGVRCVRDAPHRT